MNWRLCWTFTSFHSNITIKTMKENSSFDYVGAFALSCGVEGAVCGSVSLLDLGCHFFVSL